MSGIRKNAGPGAKCPDCGSDRVYRSRTRSAVERLRKRWSSKRLHRCHECGWRGWREETHPEHGAAVPMEFVPPDFNKIDTAVPLRPGAPGPAKDEQP
jgi:hypothetical protein